MNSLVGAWPTGLDVAVEAGDWTFLPRVLCEKVAANQLATGV